MPVNHDQPDQLPQPLISEMRQTQQRVEIPDRVDRHMLAEARRRALAIRQTRDVRRQRVLYRVAVPLTAAAVLLIGLGVWFAIMQTQQIGPSIAMNEAGEQDMADSPKSAAAGEVDSTIDGVGDVVPLPVRLAARVAQPLDEAEDVDIRAAFALAKALQEGELAHRTWDVTDDGQVDRADVDAIAQRAVSLAMHDDSSSRAFPRGSGAGEARVVDRAVDVPRGSAVAGAANRPSHEGGAG